MSSIISSSSSRSVISDREVKKLEKVLMQEAKQEQKILDHALKDMKEAEKALKKVSKEAAKAQKDVSKTKEKEYAAAKKLNKVKHKHSTALDKEAKAQDALTRSQAHEEETDRSARQSFSDLEDCQHAMEGNAKDREMRLAEIRAQLGQSDVHDPQSTRL